MSALFDAIANGKKWNDTMTRFNYREVFGSYSEQHLAACMDEIRGADDTGGLAASLLDQLEDRWKGISFFSRSAEKENDKIKAVMFFLPMLLDTGDSGCASFVSDFLQEWNSRFPKWTMQAASSEEIDRGFRRTILGFQIPDKK